jgi:DNA-binding NarL/FixJ family response regulator
MRVVLVAGEPVFRLGFRSLLSSSEDMQLVGDAPDARSGFALIDSEKPELVAIDVALRGMSGLTAIREIKARVPGARLLLLAAWPRERDALEGFAAGAHGFALKTDPPETLLYAMRALARGHTYITPDLRGCAADFGETRRARASQAAMDVLGVLSPREREVLDLIIKGWRNRNIASELCISIKTVDTHRTRINRKLHCTSAADLIRFAADNDLLRGAPWSSNGVGPATSATAAGPTAAPP